MLHAYYYYYYYYYYLSVDELQGTLHDHSMYLIENLEASIDLEW
jgi:hypothetical protein